MIWLLLSILCNTALLLILKSFDRFRVDTLQAIVVNYITAGTLGYFLSPVALDVTQGDWRWISLALGALFISIFLLIARTAQTIGVSAATVANKMSVVIPVTLAILLYNDPITFWKIGGMVMALIAVWMTTKTDAGAEQSSSKKMMLPLFVFLGSGIIDALVNYAQKKAVPADQSALFISFSFLAAFGFGLCLLLYKVMRKETTLNGRNVIAGILLGIPNYFSIYAMVRALNENIFDSSTLYPINNMGIVALSAVGAFLFFRERLNRWNIAGILLAIVAIACMTFL